MPKTKKRLKSRRIAWCDIENVDCVHLVNHGLHAHAVSAATGLTVGQVYYRAHRVGIKLRDYRNGKGPVAATLLRKFRVRGMSGQIKKDLLNTMTPIIERRLQEHKK